MTSQPGTYTVTGSAELMAVKGAGGITVMGNGLSGTGFIQFHVTETATPVTHTLKVKKKYPKSYECLHENCSIKLPDIHHHRVSCQENQWNTYTNRKHKCRRVYYRCQTSTCPLDSRHAVDYACGHTDRKENASAHELQASCSYSTIQNGQTVNCTISNFYKCKPIRCIPIHQIPLQPPLPLIQRLSLQARQRTIRRIALIVLMGVQVAR